MSSISQRDNHRISEASTTTFTATYTLTQTDINTGSVEYITTAEGTDPEDNTVTGNSDDLTITQPNDPTSP